MAMNGIYIWESIPIKMNSAFGKDNLKIILSNKQAK